MTHDSAVRIVVNLVPEIEKKGAAEVLTAHAAQEDLPPAQLEKLAQVYNTLRTVSYIDNADADQRGATVPLLDVAELVMSYATGAGREKAAAGPLPFSSHDVRVVDLNKALKAELRDGMQKAAGEVKGPISQVDNAFVEQVSREVAVAALLDLEIDLENEMSKLASEIFTAAPICEDTPFLRDISDFEAEASRRQPIVAVKAAGDYLEKFAAPHKVKLVRFDYEQPLTKYAYEIPDAYGEKLAELARVVGVYAIIKNAGALSPDDLLREALNEGNTTETSFDPNRADDPGSGQTYADVDLAELEEALADTEAPRRKLVYSDEGGGGGKEKNKTNDETKNKGGSKGITALDVAAAPFAAVGTGVAGAKQKADEIMNRIVSKERDNKAQRVADMSVEDIKRAMNVRRLIGTDPVLKDADPKVVLDIYNSIVARNPDLAGDTASLRLILREAVSYEGLTLDAQKMLTEIRRNSAQGQKESDELDRKRYAVGGVSPVSVSNSKV